MEELLRNYAPYGAILLPLFVFLLTLKEHDKMSETSKIFEDNEVESLLDAKMKCLEWAIGTDSVKEGATPDTVVDAARKYWAFIVAEDDTNG